MSEKIDTSVKYKVLIFDPAKYTGKVDNGTSKGFRRCRFCGRVLDENHFLKEAHAISVSLGNTIFICADECDECNESFGKRLENDITNFFQVFLTIYLIPKRNGKERKVTGRNFEMGASNDPHLFSEQPLITFRMRDWKDGDISNDEIVGLMRSLDVSNKTFIPQNIYKALCKYALSLMPYSLTTHYQKTIQWINDDVFVENLPKLKTAPFSGDGKEPMLVLFIRETPSNEYPLCVASLCVAYNHFVYTIPFGDESATVDQDIDRFGAFWIQLVKAAPNFEQFEDYALSGSQRAGFKVDFDIKFEPGAVPVRLSKETETGQWIIKDCGQES